MPRFVPLYRGGKLVDHAWVDTDDYHRLAPWRWILAGGYAIAGARLDSSVPALSGVPMHRFLLGLPPFDGVVHHINEDQIDNRRRNLQVAADKLAHGALPHPRRDALSGGHRDLPLHERELALVARGEFAGYVGSRYDEIEGLIVEALNVRRAQKVAA